MHGNCGQLKFSHLLLQMASHLRTGPSQCWFLPFTVQQQTVSWSFETLVCSLLAYLSRWGPEEDFLSIVMTWWQLVSVLLLLLGKVETPNILTKKKGLASNKKKIMEIKQHLILYVRLLPLLLGVLVKSYSLPHWQLYDTLSTRNLSLPCSLRGTQWKLFRLFASVLLV